jgi:hypothetical protein
LGWTDGRNVRLDYRWTAANADEIRKYATELVALAPDVILATGASTMGPLLQATRAALARTIGSLNHRLIEPRTKASLSKGGSEARSPWKAPKKVTAWSSVICPG